MHPPVHMSTATTFPRRPARVRGASVLNQGPPPANSGACAAPAPPGSAANPTAASSSRQDRERTGPPPFCLSAAPSLNEECKHLIMTAWRPLHQIGRAHV